MSLKNQLVLITGASSGIGAACAQHFAEQGARLILVARSLDKLNAIADKLNTQHNTDCHVLQLDVSDAAAVEEALTNLPADYQAIDILINNAGLAQGLDKVYEADINDWDTMIDVNIKGLLYVTRIVSAGMMERNTGHIINVGSISAHQVYAGGGVYCATKFAVKALTRGIKMDVHGTPIRVSQVDPGMANTNYAVTRFKGDQETADAIYAGMTPLTGDDVAETVVFCASRPAHVNISEIQVLPVDQTAQHMVHKV